MRVHFGFENIFLRLVLKRFQLQNVHVLKMFNKMPQHKAVCKCY